MEVVKLRSTQLDRPAPPVTDQTEGIKQAKLRLVWGDNNRERKRHTAALSNQEAELRRNMTRFDIIIDFHYQTYKPIFETNSPFKILHLPPSIT